MQETKMSNENPSSHIPHQGSNPSRIGERLVSALRPSMLHTWPP